MQENKSECFFSEHSVVPPQIIWGWYTAVDGWAVTFGTAGRELGGAVARRTAVKWTVRYGFN